MTRFIALLLLALSSNALAEAKKPVWVYASVYKEYIAPIEAAFEAEHPDIDVMVFQAGSEKIQAKVEAEQAAKKLQADVLMISDPFWGSELESRGLAVKRPSVEYQSLLVLISNSSVPAAERPKSFKELEDARFKGKVQIASPLESGTAFAGVAYLSEKFGWDYFKKLRENDVASSGGNSVVIQKVESGEKKFGIVLLENALAAKKRGSPIDVIYPAEGGIPIPSVQIVFEASQQKAAAIQFADFVLSKKGQELLRNGYMYSVRKDVAPPEGAKPFAEASKGATPWTPERIKKVAASAKEIKKKFATAVLE